MSTYKYSCYRASAFFFFIHAVRPAVNIGFSQAQVVVGLAPLLREESAWQAWMAG